MPPYASADALVEAAFGSEEHLLIAIADLMQGKRPLAVDTFGEEVGAIEFTQADATRAVGKAVAEIETRGTSARQPVVYLVGKTWRSEYVPLLADLALRLLDQSTNPVLLYQALCSLDDCAPEADPTARAVWEAVVERPADPDSVELARSLLGRSDP